VEKQREGSVIQCEVLLLELVTDISKCSVTLFCDGPSYLRMFRTRIISTPRIQLSGKHSHLPADTASQPRSLESSYACFSTSLCTFMARWFNLPQGNFPFSIYQKANPGFVPAQVLTSLAMKWVQTVSSITRTVVLTVWYMAAMVM